MGAGGRSSGVAESNVYELAYQFGNIRYIYANTKLEDLNILRANLARRLIYVTLTQNDTFKKLYYYNSTTKRIEVVNLHNLSGEQLTAHERHLVERVTRIWRDRHTKKK